MQCRVCRADAAYPECAPQPLPAHLSCRAFETALRDAILAREAPCGVSKPVFVSVVTRKADGATNHHVEAPLVATSSSTYEYCVRIDDTAFGADAGESGWEENGAIPREIVAAVAKRISALPGVTSDVRVSHTYTRVHALARTDIVVCFSFTKMY